MMEKGEKKKGVSSLARLLGKKDTPYYIILFRKI